MNLFRINTTAFHEEDFTIYTDLTKEQVTTIVQPIVYSERFGDGSYNNDDLVSALNNAYPNNYISQRYYNEPEMISI
jgi:hypothetical protein